MKLVKIVEFVKIVEIECEESRLSKGVRGV